MADKEHIVDCPQRVAFDLMSRIAMNEPDEKKLKPDARTYYLTLYTQCHKAAVLGHALESVLRTN